MTTETDIRLRSHALSNGGKRLLRQRLQDLAGTERSQAPGGRLVAVIVGSNVDSPGLRSYCKDHLPPYMVPQVFSVIDELPKTPAGKIDRKALQNRNWLADPVGQNDIVAPRTPVEEKLAAIWADVLGADEINIHDNFFELGGDSLLTIRILSRAAKAGLSIAPDAFFANPTIAEQARLVERAPEVLLETGPVSGELPLTPIQHWFFDHIRTDPQQWNLSFLFELGMPVSPPILARAIDEILRHHDALRSTFTFSDGDWTAEIAASIENFSLRTIDISMLDAAAVRASIANVASELNADIDLGQAPLFRVAHFAAGPASPDHLLFVVHHLVIDTESWRVLLSDFEILLEQLSRGSNIELPTRTTSLQHWAARLADHANSKSIDDDRAYWLNAMPGRAIEIPVDHELHTASNLEADSTTLTFELPRSATEALVESAQRDLHASMNAILLSALARTIAEWAGQSTVALDTEGHGREPLFEKVDLSRTVGWFTTVYPLVLRAPDADLWRSPNGALRLVKETMQKIPQNGISFGLIKELSRNPETNGEMEQYGGARVLFNYLGQIDRGADNENLLRLVDARCGPGRSVRCERAYLIEINASIADGQLRAEFAYSASIHDAATIQRLGQRFIAALDELTGSATGTESSAVVASDFPLAGMDQQEFEVLSAQLEALDDD